MPVHTAFALCSNPRFSGLCGWSEKWTRILSPRPLFTQNIERKPLSTCDGQEARERAAILAAQFDTVRRTVNACFMLDHPVSLLPISHRSRTGKPRLERS